MSILLEISEVQSHKLSFHFGTMCRDHVNFLMISLSNMGPLSTFNVFNLVLKEQVVHSYSGTKKHLKRFGCGSLVSTRSSKF